MNVSSSQLKLPEVNMTQTILTPNTHVKFLNPSILINRKNQVFRIHSLYPIVLSARNPAEKQYPMIKVCLI